MVSLPDFSSLPPYLLIIKRNHDSAGFIPQTIVRQAVYCFMAVDLI